MSKNNSLQYWIFVLVVVLLSIVAYAGYVLYPRFDLPSATSAGLLVLSVGAGIASFFAPCSFPLLVTLLGREVGANEAEGYGDSTRRALTFATALSLGAITFLVLSGIILALGGNALFANFTFTSPQAMTTRVVVGAVLILLGLVQAGVINTEAFGKFGKLANWQTLLLKPKLSNVRRSHFVRFSSMALAI
jgi:cytochrome c biogenesis protein CcdA